MVERFTPQGQLNADFNGTGLRDLAPAGSAASILNGTLVQGDGKVLVCGAVTNATGDFLLIRLNANGSNDFAFNTTGSAVADFTGTMDRANGLTLQSDGRILVVGEANAGAQDYNFAVARYRNNVLSAVPDIHPRQQVCV